MNPVPASARASSMRWHQHGWNGPGVMVYPGELGLAFPKLTSSNSRESSRACLRYNCIAWAANDATRPWWPNRYGVGYWPQGIHEETLKAFVATYGSVGYTICDSPWLEEGVEKIAIYTDADGRPKHAARQLPDGRWTSKMGVRGIDIEHESLALVAGAEYGDIACYMKRPIGGKREAAEATGEPYHNRIPLPFDKAVEGLLAVKPKKRAVRKKKPAKK